MPTPRSDSSTDGVRGGLTRVVALSGIEFAVLLLPGWFLSGGDTPDYTAANDEDWIDWTESSRSKSGIGAFLTLLAGVVFLHFADTIRSVLGGAETTVRGSAQLAQVAFAGAITGIVCITMWRRIGIRRGAFILAGKTGGDHILAIPVPPRGERVIRASSASRAITAAGSARS